MSLPVLMRAEAIADVRDIHAELESVRRGMGSQFESRLRYVLEGIEAMPEMYGIVSLDVRAAPLRQFR